MNMEQATESESETGAVQASPSEKPKRVMHPNSLEALRRGREKAFAKRAELNLGDKTRLKKELATIERAERIKKKVEEIKELRQEVVKRVSTPPEPVKAVKVEPPPSDFDESCPEAVDWKNYYKAKYQAKLQARKQPEYQALFAKKEHGARGLDASEVATMARERLRQQAQLHAKQLAWQSVFPGVPY